MAVKGIQDALRNTVAVVNAVASLKAERAVTVALSIGGAYATMLTPVDTSNLVNSQFRRVNVNGNMITGHVGYTAQYALWVHESSGKLKGQPRAHFGKTRAGKEFGGGTGVGNYWDPKAEPGFLRKGFDDNRARIDAAVKKAFEL